MSTPSKLNGIQPSITIDGTDLHTMGMIVEDYSNSAPRVRSASIQIPNRDGDFDFSESLEPRTITISGSIIADNHTQLKSNIDELNKFFRIRENGKPLKLVFQDQTDRYWSVKYDGEFDIRYNGKWSLSKTARFSLKLKCIKPYSEAVSVTSHSFPLHIFNAKEINYTGTVKTPISLTLKTKKLINLVDQANSENVSENGTGSWNPNNSVPFIDEDTKVYGNSSIKISQYQLGTYSADVNTGLGASNTAGRYFVFGGTIKTDPNKEAFLKVVMVGGNNLQASESSGSDGIWKSLFIKLQPSDFTNASRADIRIESISNDVLSKIFVDGLFAYEITAAEYADSNYVPPPYVSETENYTYWVKPKNPEINIFNNINLWPLRNGEIGTGVWSHNTDANFASIPDPFDSGQKCLSFAFNAATQVSLPYIFTFGAGYYKFSCDCFCEGLVGGDEIGVYSVTRMEGAEDDIIFDNIFRTTATTWTQKSDNVIPAFSRTKLYLVVWAELTSPKHVKFYMRNIQFCKVNNPELPAPEYNTPSILESKWTGTLGENETLHIDYSTLTAKRYNNQSVSYENGITQLAGNQLQLSPGTNFIRYTDAREGATNPEKESSGIIDCILSYRARYL